MWPNIPLRGIWALQKARGHGTGRNWHTLDSWSKRSLATNVSSQPKFPHFRSTTANKWSMTTGALTLFLFKRTRHTGHFEIFWWHLTQIRCPLIHYKKQQLSVNTKHCRYKSMTYIYWNIVWYLLKNSNI